MHGGEVQAEIGEDDGHRLGFRFGGVVEMGAGAENLHAGKAGRRDLPQQFPSQLPPNKQIRR